MIVLLLACGGEVAPVEDPDPDPPSASDDEMLIALGYLAEGNEASGKSGVTVFDRERAVRGRNLLVSAHHSGAELVDLDGTVLHRWSKSFEETQSWRDWGKTYGNKTRHWRRARVFPNGDIVGVFGGHGMVALDADSEILWATDNRAHHDLQIVGDSIYTVTRARRFVPWLSKTLEVNEDFIVVLDREGIERRKVSVLEALMRSDYAGLYEPKGGVHKRYGDIFHTNTMHVIERDGAHPAFKKGNVLTSMRDLDVIGIIDLDAEQFVWARRGSWRRQHDPRVTDAGTLLVFDNRGGGGGPGNNPQSRILEYDVRKDGRLEPVWILDSPDGDPFYSRLCGAAYRLDGGNTLVVDTDNGRAFEVTRDHETVWEYHNPHRAPTDATRVARLFDVQRLPPTFGDSFVSSPATE